jgi:hypothetical protein
MDHESAVAAVFLFVSLAAMVVGVAHYWYKARTERPKMSADVERRLARLEVAIDDMSAAIGQMADSQRFLTAALGQRGLPVEVPRGSE